MALESPTTSPSRSDGLNLWLSGLSWVLVLVLLPLVFLAVGLETGYIGGNPHG